MGISWTVRGGDVSYCCWRGDVYVMCWWATYICRVVDSSVLEDSAGLLVLPDKGKIMHLFKIKKGRMLHLSSAILLCPEMTLSKNDGTWKDLGGMVER